MNHHRGFITFINKRKTLYQRTIKITNKNFLLTRSNFKRLEFNIQQKNYLLNLDQLKYLINIQVKTSKFYLQLSKNQQLGIRVTNSFRTLTGGILYYDYRNIFKFSRKNQQIFYYSKKRPKKQYTPTISYRTIIWLEEEFYKVNCESNILLVEHGDFISEGFEIIPGLFSRTSGMILIKQKNNL